MAVIHDEDHVRVHDRGHALGDDDLGGFGDIGPEALADEGVGARIHRAGGIVEDQDLRLLQEGAGDAEPLLLPAGDVGAPLLDMGVVAVGEGADKLVRLGEPAGLGQLLVGGVFIAPAQILGDRAREELVFLQHHRNSVSQRVQVVLTHVCAADLHAALRHVVEAGDELHQRRLARARAAQDADRRARGDNEVDVVEGVVFGAGGILEGHVREFDAAVLDLGHGMRGARERGHFHQHLADALGGLGGDGEHDVDHGQHHEAHEHLHAIVHHGGDLPHVDDRAARGHDDARAHREDEEHVEIHAKLHQRGVEGDDALGPGEVHADAVRRRAEFLLLVVLAGKALDHAHAAHVLLNGLVELVVLAEDGAEGGHGVLCDQNQPAHQHRHHHHEGEGQLAAHEEGHGDGEDEHQRGAHGDADEHHEGHLDVGHVGGHARHQRGGGKAVDVLEGKALHAGEHILAQIAGKAGGGVGAGLGRGRPAQKRGHRHQHELSAQRRHLGKRHARLDHIDHVGGVEGDEHFKEDFPDDKEQREQRGAFVLPQTPGKGFDHGCDHVLSFGYAVKISIYCITPAPQIKRQFVNNLGQKQEAAVTPLPFFE